MSRYNSTCIADPEVIDVIDGAYQMPKRFRKARRVVLKTPFSTEVSTYNPKKGGTLHWYATKHPELAPDKLVINGILFQTRHINTLELIGAFLTNIIGGQQLLSSAIQSEMNDL